MELSPNLMVLPPGKLLFSACHLFVIITFSKGCFYFVQDRFLGHLIMFSSLTELAFSQLSCYFVSQISRECGFHLVFIAFHHF